MELIKSRKRETDEIDYDLCILCHDVTKSNDPVQIPTPKGLKMVKYNVQERIELKDVNKVCKDRGLNA